MAIPTPTPPDNTPDELQGGFIGTVFPEFGTIKRAQPFSGNAGNKSYKYPKVLFDAMGDKVFNLIDYVQFEPVEYIPPYSTPISNPQAPSTAEQSSNLTFSQLNVDSDFHKLYNSGDYKPVDSKVYLPMPESLGVDYGNKWDEAKLTYTGRMAIDIAYGMLSSGETITSESIAAKLQALGSDATINMVSELAAMGLNLTVSNISGEGFLAGTLGAIPNPSVDLVFGLPNLRVFNFNYKLVALSEEDAKNIRLITSLFKRNMYVTTAHSEDSKINNKNRFLLAPNMFKVTFMRGKNRQNPTLFSMKICALEDFNVRYGGSGGGYRSVLSENNFIAQEIDISMRFRENKILLAPDDFDESDSFINNNGKVSH